MSLNRAIQRLPTTLVLAQQWPLVGKVIRVFVWLLLGVDVPQSVRIGPDFTLMHRGTGVVIHRNTTIGAGVRVFPGVTVGSRRVGDEDTGTCRFEIADGAVLGSGAKILGGDQLLRVGRNTVVGANAVLTTSTGDDEVWVGVPARCIRRRGKPVAQ
jgi:serine O-acetyltransferase